MAKIQVVQKYDGFDQVLKRFHLQPHWKDMIGFLEAIPLKVMDRRNENGAAALRAMIDKAFENRNGWSIIKQGGIDWIKTIKNGKMELKLGIEIQVSSRSDLIAVDLMHLNQGFKEGSLDAGAILVPSNDLASRLVDRAPNLRETMRHFDLFTAIKDRPVALLTIEQDGFSPIALPKQKRKA